jgi:FKBP-type peptidyl-prolyl cis-trans isomerase
MRPGVLIVLVGVLLGACHLNDVGISASDQLAEDVAAIDSYLAANSIDAVKDSSGIRYVIHTDGTGPLPIRANCIQVNYTGKLLSDGSQFDSKSNFKYPLGLMITGWQVVLPKIHQGSKVTLYIPSGYAYGSAKQDGIPANSNLIFDIELLNAYVYQVNGTCSDTPRLPDDEQLVNDVALINKYLNDNNVTNIQTHPSGLRYTVESLGTGAKPTTANCVFAKYTGKLLADGTQFDQNTSGFRSPLSKLIEGWQIGLSLLPTGTKATLYIPSSLGYGSADSSTIPANSNLVFQVELVDLSTYNAATGTCN